MCPDGPQPCARGFRKLSVWGGAAGHNLSCWTQGPEPTKPEVRKPISDINSIVVCIEPPDTEQSTAETQSLSPCVRLLQLIPPCAAVVPATNLNNHHRTSVGSPTTYRVHHKPPFKHVSTSYLWPEPFCCSRPTESSNGPLSSMPSADMRDGPLPELRETVSGPHSRPAVTLHRMLP